MAEMGLQEQMLASLREAIAYKKEGRTDLARVVTMTARTTAVEPPPAYAPAQIINIRAQLGMSQAVFAAALNVSGGTVSAWEQGDREPSGPSLRLLELAEKAPEHFGAVLKMSGRRELAMG